MQTAPHTADCELLLALHVFGLFLLFEALISRSQCYLHIPNPILWSLAQSQIRQISILNNWA